ncbi:MAG: DNA/RNA non-specific endonuclease [Chloroflexi bacterium]|nr:DNA/RNA non-specific endonuclease [Chloroflexota bacterium]
MAETRKKTANNQRQQRNAERQTAHSERATHESDAPVALQEKPLYPAQMLGDARLRGRGNSGVNAVLIAQVQQTHGNHAVQRYLQRTAAIARPLSISEHNVNGSAVAEVALNDPFAVQRCGAVACDCPPEQKALAETTAALIAPLSETPPDKQPVLARATLTPTSRIAKSDHRASATLKQTRRVQRSRFSVARTRITRLARTVSRVQRLAAARTPTGIWRTSSSVAVQRWNPFSAIANAASSAWESIKSCGGSVLSAVQNGFNTVRDLGAKAMSTASSLGQKAFDTGKNLGQKAFDTAQSVGKKAGQSALSLGSQAFNSAKEIGGRAIKSANDVGQQALTSAKNIGTKVVKNAGEVGNKALSSAKNLGGKVLETASGLGNKAIEKARAVVSAAMEKGKRTGSVVSSAGAGGGGTLGSKAMSAVKAIANNALSNVKSTGKNIFDKTRNAGTRGVDNIKRLGSNVLAKARQMGESARNFIKGSAGRLLDNATRLGERAWASAKSIGSNALERARSLGQSAVSTAKELGGQAWNSAKELGSSILNTARGIGGGSICSAAVSMVNTILNTARTVGSRAMDTAKGLASRAMEAAQKMAARALDVAKNLAEKAVDSAKKMADKALQMAKSLADQAIDNAKAWATRALQNAEKLATTALDNVKKLAEKAIQAAENMASRALDSAKRLVGKALDIAGSAAEALGRGLAEGALVLIKKGLKLAGIDEGLIDTIVGFLQNAGSLMLEIAKNPGTFLRNLVNAVKGGFGKFASNIAQHLQQGLIGWLTGTMSGMGIEMPATLDMKGIFSLVLQVIGVTADKIREKVTRIIGKENVEGAEAAYGAASKAVSQGPALLDRAWSMVSQFVSGGVGGLWEKAADYVGDLKSVVFDGIKNWVIEKVVTQAVIKVASMFNPAGAIFQIANAAYQVIVFIKERGAQIAAVGQSVVQSVSEIAAGSIGGAISAIDQTLARILPVAISFLADIIGLGGIAEKVREIISKVRDVVGRAIDKALRVILTPIKKIADKVRSRIMGVVGAVKGRAGAIAGAVKEKVGGVVGGVRNRLEKMGKRIFGGKGKGGGAPSDQSALHPVGVSAGFSIDGEKHRLYTSNASGRPELMVASTPQPVAAFLATVQTSINEIDDSDERKNLLLTELAEARSLSASLQQQLFAVGQASRQATLEAQLAILIKLLKAVWIKARKTQRKSGDISYKADGDRPSEASGWLKRSSDRSGSAQRAVSRPVNEAIERLNNQLKEAGSSGSIGATFDAGHLIGDKLGGSGGAENLVPMESGMNQNWFNTFEGKVRGRVEKGEEIYASVRATYDDGKPFDKLIDDADVENNKEILSPYVPAFQRIPHMIAYTVRRGEEDGKESELYSEQFGPRDRLGTLGKIVRLLEIPGAKRVGDVYGTQKEKEQAAEAARESGLKTPFPRQKS